MQRSTAFLADVQTGVSCRCYLGAHKLYEGVGLVPKCLGLVQVGLVSVS